MNFDKLSLEKMDFDKLTGGLIPAIIQDASTRRVLMLGFMNREALQESIARKQVVFWSRTKQRLWQKGETSGNVLNIVSIIPDCDNDSLLILASPSGPVCHSGNETCFGADQPDTIADLEAFSKLFELIQDRKTEMPENSYTVELLKSGIKRIAQKVGEEAVELAIAAQHDDRKRCIEESADLIYHLFVLMAEKNISLSEVTEELKSRRK